MAKKPCPVDRGKLLIGLEFCRQEAVCVKCPYRIKGCDADLSEDALAYILYLEEKLHAKADVSD